MRFTSPSPQVGVQRIASVTNLRSNPSSCVSRTRRRAPTEGVSTKALLAAAAAAILGPSTFILGVTVIAGGAAAGGSAAAAATVVCTYAYPDAERIADTMSTLTDEPVQAAQWDRYADLIGVDPAEVRWGDSTDVQRDELLFIAVRNLLNTTTPAAITTPPLIWWHGTVPDDADTTWENTPVPGWNGTLGVYLAAFVEDYATNPDHTWDEHQCIPPAPTACGQPAETTAILATIRHFESGDDYTQQSHAVATGGRNGGGNPTGAYQFVYTSWDNYAGYAEAFMAPPNVQDELATTNVTSILDAFDGDPAWVPVAWYVGMGGARNVQDGTWSTAYVPNPAFNHMSIGDYQARWLDYYTTIALPAAGGTATVCPQGGPAAVAWAETQIGAPYAAANGYRFGAPPWPGGTIIGDRGHRYTFPAGTIVYDCSGFVVAAWRAAGVDLVAQYGLYGSQAFPNSPLEEIARSAVVPGDLAVYSVSASGVGHIVLIHDVSADGTVHTIEATPGKGVHIDTIDWSRVISIKRPASPEAPPAPDPP